MIITIFNIEILFFFWKIWQWLSNITTPVLNKHLYYVHPDHSKQLQLYSCPSTKSTPQLSLIDCPSCDHLRSQGLSKILALRCFHNVQQPAINTTAGSLDRPIPEPWNPLTSNLLFKVLSTWFHTWDTQKSNVVPFSRDEPHTNIEILVRKLRWLKRELI